MASAVCFVDVTAALNNMAQQAAAVSPLLWLTTSGD